MTHITTTPIMVLSTGFTRGQGRAIYESELPPDLWQKFVTDGVIVPNKPAQKRATRRRKTNEMD